MITSDLYRAQLLTGLYSRVARQLKLQTNGRSHVRRVASGERQSPRVEAALLAEMIRIDRAVERFTRKLEKTRKNRISNAEAA